MNITGFKRRIRKVTKELKEGERSLGIKRYNYLEKQKRCWKNKIENLRKNKHKK